MRITVREQSACEKRDFGKISTYDRLPYNRFDSKELIDSLSTTVVTRRHLDPTDLIL
jgi:hypothetical protein